VKRGAAVFATTSLLAFALIGLYGIALGSGSSGPPTATPPPFSVDLSPQSDVIQALEAREGFSAKLYDDGCTLKDPRCGKGNCTIGYGHLLHFGPCTATDSPKTVTPEEAYSSFLVPDVKAKLAGINNQDPPYPSLNSFELIGLLDLAFNKPKGLSPPSPSYPCQIGPLLQQHKLSEAIDIWLMPKCTGTKVLPGLINRRAAEVFDFTYGREGFPFTPAGGSGYRGCLPFEKAAGIGRCGGAKIAFDPGSSDGSFQVWTADVDGSSRDLGPGDSPVMSPSGAFVAASLEPDQTGAVLYSTTGAPPIEVPSVADDAVQPLAFSPDSHYLAMTVSRSLGSSTSRLEVFDINTGRVDTVTSGVINGVSFNPTGGGQLVYGYAPNDKQSAPDNLYTWTPGDPKPRSITDDGRSANPVWGPKYIAYDHEFEHDINTPFREKGAQIWLRSLNGKTGQLTKVPVGQLQYGLVPTAFSASGGRLLAEYQEQDIPEAWIVNVPSGGARRIRVKGQTSTIIFGDGLAANGKSVLLDVPLGPSAYSDSLVSVPVGGGTPRVLVKRLLDDKASWNQ
jgi:GH24 family phage-related lysozyme (muramidase)